MHPQSDSPSPLLKVVVVCTGNICRSPVGEIMLRGALEDAGIADAVTLSSCGLGGWHVGDGADRRAVDQLQQDGYDGTPHRAEQYGPQHADSDVFLVMDTGHATAMRRLGVDPQRIFLYRSFDPESVAAAGGTGRGHTNANPELLSVPDPYYGTDKDFRLVAEQIAASIPGIIDYLCELLEERRAAGPSPS